MRQFFSPGFSAKESGTGLGLAISGEALKRNKGNLKAYTLIKVHIYELNWGI